MFPCWVFFPANSITLHVICIGLTNPCCNALFQPPKNHVKENIATCCINKKSDIYCVSYLQNQPPRRGDDGVWIWSSRFRTTATTPRRFYDRPCQLGTGDRDRGHGGHTAGQAGSFSKFKKCLLSLMWDSPFLPTSPAAVALDLWALSQPA